MRLKSVKQLLKLRREFISAYNWNTGDDLFKELDSKDQEHDYYGKIRDEIRTTLILGDEDEIRSNQTFRSFLFDDEKIGYYDTTLDVFRKYIAIVNAKKRTGKKSIHEHFQGAITISKRFVDEVSSTFSFDTPDKFYLAKQDNLCQWYGVINNWDVKRKDSDKIIKKIVDSFKSAIVYNNIVAIVLGDSGYGKSTFLRHLALAFIEEVFKVVWVQNLRLFEGDLTSIELDIKQHYLLIVDDWEETKINVEIANSFIARCSKMHNVRLAIGDYQADNKEYSRYKNSDNVFRLSPLENKDIVLKIIENNTRWQRIKPKVLKQINFAAIPLYILLFVLVHEANTDKIEDVDGEDYLIEFKRIIEVDLQKIYAYHQGLAKAIYYLTLLHNKYNIPFSWQIIVRFANEDHNQTKLDENLKFDNYIGKILTKYIYTSEVLLPGSTNVQIINFHHGLLPKLGLNQNIFGLQSLKEFLPVLSELSIKWRPILKSSYYLSSLWPHFVSFSNDLISINKAEWKIVEEKVLPIIRIPSIYFDMKFNEFLKIIYREAELEKHLDIDLKRNESLAIEYDLKWKRYMLILFGWMTYDLSKNHRFYIMTIYKRGCKSPLVEEMYKKSISLKYIFRPSAHLADYNKKCLIDINKDYEAQLLFNRYFPVELSVASLKYVF